MFPELNVASLVAHPATIVFVALGLLTWAVLSGWWLWRGTRRLIGTLRRATSVIERAPDERAFAHEYESIANDLKNDSILGPRWREYDDSLVARQKPVPHYRSTTRASTWFDSDLLRMPVIGLDLRYHAALPNLLVGAGLLFTFIGLAVALGSASDVVAGGAAERSTALKQLLDTASFKFITSLVGLGLSILYALFRKGRLKAVDHALDVFLATLEARVPLLTPVALQQEANELLREQSDQLQAFSTDLAVSIGETVDRAFDHRLGEHIQPLTEAMQQLAAGMSSRNEDAMQHMLDGFIQRLQGGAGDRMQDVAASLESLSARLEGLQSGLGNAAVRMAESADAMAARMGEGAEAALSRITDQMGGLADTLRAVADQTRGAGAEAGRELAGRIEAAAAGFEEAARNVATALAHAAEGLQGRMDQQAEASAARLATQVETMVGALRALAEGSRAAGSEAFAALADRVGSAAAGFEATASKVAEALERAASDTGGALGRGAEQAVERIAAATEGMRTEMRTLIEEFRVAATNAGDTLQAGGAAGAEALRTSLGGAGESVATALSGVSEQLTRAGERAGAALQTGGEAAGSRLDEAGSGFGSRADGLARQVAALTSAADGIVVRLADFERAAREAAAPLSAASSDLKAAGQAARSAVEPLGQAAQAIGKTAEQIAGVGQRIEVTQAATGRLAESLTSAVGRFEGVDKALARVLGELQVGLQGFREEVAKTVQQTDSNLGKAANYLGNAVKDLEEVLEEFGAALPANGGGGAVSGRTLGAR